MVVTWDDSVFKASVRAATMRGIVKATEAVKTEAIRLILSGPKTGRDYRRRSVLHKASAPGEPPASDTGTLVNSIATEYDQAALTGQVVVRAPYGPYLEFGTQKMEPRPFLRPAVANVRAKAVKLIVDELTGVIGK